MLVQRLKQDVPGQLGALTRRMAWDGSEIRIVAGTYPEAVTIAKRTKLVAYGGTVRIGD